MEENGTQNCDTWNTGRGTKHRASTYSLRDSEQVFEGGQNPEVHYYSLGQKRLTFS